MNASSSRLIRTGGALALLAALLAFAVRAAEGQTPTPRKLSLGEAARLAAAQTANVQTAELRVQQARSRVTQTRSALMPQVDVAPNWSNHTVNSATFGFNFPVPAGQRPLLDPAGQIIGPVRIWDFRGGASQSVYDAPATQRVRAARAGVNVASADVATTAEASATSAAVMYIRAIRGEAATHARLADSALAADLLNIARDQVEAGVGIALDVTRAQSQLAASRSQLIVARNDRDRSRLDLLRALNLPLETPIELTDSLPTLPLDAPVSEQAAIDLALRTRPDIKSADAQLEAQKQQIAITRATRLPKVSVFANDGQNGFIDHLLNTYTYGVQVSVPVFEGGRREAIAQEQTSQAREIEVRQRDLRQQVALDVRSAILDLASAREQVDAAQTRQRLAEQEVQQARERFRAGVASNADVITASVTLNSARTNMIDALTAYHAARVSLAHAEGAVTQLR